MLIEAGDLAAAERVCAAALARSRDAGDLENLARLLTVMAILDLQAGRVEDAAAHLREALQIAARTGGWFDAAQRPGLLRAPVRRDRAPRRGRHGVGRVRRARRGTRGRGLARGCAPPGGAAARRPGRRSDPTGPGRPRNAARR